MATQPGVAEGVDVKSPPAWKPQGIIKSNSIASASIRSTRSHDSVPVIGAYPLGTLRVHQPGSPSPAVPLESLDDADELPPPLDPLPGAGTLQNKARDSEYYLSSQSHEKKYRPSPPRDLLVHGMGGGDVVLILDLPEVFTVGYDAISFTAKHFGGVRDIPAGPHFFWVANLGGTSARCGFWITSSGVNAVHVMQWDKFTEDIGQSARAEARIQADNVDTFHSKLVPYSDPSAVPSVDGGQLEPAKTERNQNIWRQLTGNVTQGMLDRVTGQLDGDWQVHTGDRVKGAILMAGEMELDRSMTKSVFRNRQLKFSFSQLSRIYSTERFGAERTLEATDATSYIASLIVNSSDGFVEGDLVGEFQFCYLVGMHLGNDSCIQQWWHMLLKLILKAYSLPALHPALASAFLRTLAAQLSYGIDWLEESIFDYSESNSRELRLSLIVYKRRLEELLDNADATPAVVEVGTAFARLESVIAELGWDIHGQYLRKGKVMMEDGEEVELEMIDLEEEDERGEWAPEIVDLDEHGRQRDLVSWTD